MSTISTPKPAAPATTFPLGSATKFTIEHRMIEDLAGSPVDIKSGIHIDAPGQRDAKAHVAIQAVVDGEKLIDVDQDMTSRRERAAAGPMFDALVGSGYAQRSVPFEEGEVANGTIRFSFTEPDGNRRMVIEPEDSPDFPEDAKLEAAFDHYMVESGIGKMFDVFPEE